MSKVKVLISGAWIFLLPIFCFSQVDEVDYPLPLVRETKATVDSLNSVADSLLYLQLRNPFKIITRALQIAETISYSKGKAECYFNIAQVHRFITHDFEMALEYYDRSIELTKDQDYLIHGRCLIGKTAIAHIKGELWNTQPLLIEASSILSKANSSLAKSLAYEMKSYLFVNEMNYDSSFIYLTKALDLQRISKQSPRRISYTLSALTLFVLEHNDTLRAKQYLIELLNISRQHNLKSLTATGYFLFARIKTLEGAYTEALKMCKSGLQLENMLPIRSAHSPFYFSLTGNCYLELGKYDSAKIYFRKSLAFSEGNKASKAHVYSLFSAVFNKEKQFDSAYFYASLSSEALQAVLTESTSLVKNLNDSYKSKLSNQESVFLQRAIRIDRIIIAISLALIFSGILAILILFRSRKKHKELSRILSAKNDEISAQSEELLAQSEELAVHSQMLESSYASLKLLDEAGKGIIGSLKIEQIIDASYHRVKSLIKISSFGIGIYDQREEQLIFPRIIRNNKVQSELAVPLNDRSSLFAWCFLNLQAVNITDIKIEHHKYVEANGQTFWQDGDISYLCCPLMGNGQAIGVIYVGNDLPNSFSDHDLDLIKNIANYVSIAIENSSTHEQLAEKHKLLIGSNALKEKLISIITHDIKGPMNSLRGLLQLLSDSQTLSSSEKDMLMVRLNSNFDQAIKMMEGVLIWTRSQMSGNKIAKNTFTIRDLVERVIGILAEVALGKEVSISNKVSDSEVYADEVMIEMVFRNLVSNAIKFSHPGGQIIISSEENESGVKVCIEDNGVGISENAIKLMFQIENRYTTYGTRKERGTGIGLYLCKEFITQNGGDIWVESKQGKGSKFFFSIPLSHAHHSLDNASARLLKRI